MRSSELKPCFSVSNCGTLGPHRTDSWNGALESVNSNNKLICFPLFSFCRVLVSPRQNLTRITLKGTFQGAKVVRGPDWEWGNQDGKLLWRYPV